MAKFATSSSGLLVNSQEHFQVFQKTEINNPTSRMKTTSPSRMRRNNTDKEFCVGKTHFTCVPTAAVEKRQKFSNWETKQIDPVANFTDTIGSMVHDGLVYRENIMIRSFEIGFDGNISLATLSNYLQDTSLNHMKIIGLLTDGLGGTPEMNRKDLIWVVSTIKIVIDRYPSWHDIVQVDTWIYQSGLNGIGRDWIVRDGRTGETVAHATCVYFLMTKKTRKLSRLIKEVKEELAPYMMDSKPTIISKNARKKLQFDVHTADYSCTVTPGWNDLDLNQHVNNVRYINWILQNVPQSMLEHHKLSAITLEYRKECKTDSTIQSLSKIVKKDCCIDDDDNQVELDHLLLLDNGQEILRGSTMWKPRDDNFSFKKYKSTFQLEYSTSHIPAETAENCY